MKIKDSPQVTSCWLFLNNYNDARNNECKIGQQVVSSCNELSTFQQPSSCIMKNWCREQDMCRIISQGRKGSQTEHIKPDVRENVSHEALENQCNLTCLSVQKFFIECTCCGSSNIMLRCVYVYGKRGDTLRQNSCCYVRTVIL